MAKKIGLMLLTLGLAASALLLYYWRQATQLPAGYAPTAPSTHLPSTHLPSTHLNERLASERAETAKAEWDSLIETEIAAQSTVENNLSQNQPDNQPDNQPVEVELTPEEFNTLVATELTARESLQFTKGVNTTIDQGVLESGVVINLADIPTETLDQQRQEILQQVIKTFPVLENHDVYIGIAGRPSIEQGQLQWDQNTRFKIGGLSLSLETAAQQLGLSPAELQQLISWELESLNISHMEVTEAGVLIRGVLD